MLGDAAGEFNLHESDCFGIIVRNMMGMLRPCVATMVLELPAHQVHRLEDGHCSQRPHPYPQACRFQLFQLKPIQAQELTKHSGANG